MTGFVFTLTEINHKEHISTEPKTITEILDKYGYTNGYYVVWKHIGEVNVGQIRQRDSCSHRPYPTLQTITTNHHSSYNTTYQEAYCTNYTIHCTILNLGKCYPSLCLRCL